MAYQIPKAPDIVGGQEVLRQPNIIQSSSVVIDNKIDATGLKDAFTAIGKWAEDFSKDEQDTMFNDSKLKFVDWAEQEWSKIKNDHQGRDANQLYDRYMKGAIDDYVKDVIDSRKDDGGLRFDSRNKALQKAFIGWVDSQRMSYINDSASYYNQQFQIYKKSEYEGSLSTAATTILNAGDNRLKLETGVQMVKDTIRIHEKDKDPAYVNSMIARAVNDDVTAYLMSIASNNPIDASFKLDMPEIRGYLTQESIDKINEKIASFYKGKAVNDVADKFGSGYMSGSIDDALLSRILKTTDKATINAYKSEIIKEGKDKYNAIQSNLSGIADQQTNSATSTFLQGYKIGNAEIENQGLTSLYQIAPDKAIALSNSMTRMQAKEAAVRSLPEGLSLVDVEEEINKYSDTMLDMDAENYANAELDKYNEAPVESQIIAKGVDVAKAIAYPGSSTIKGLFSNSKLKEDLKNKYKKEHKSASSDDSIVSVLTDMAGRGDIDPAHIDGLSMIIQDTRKERDNKESFYDVYKQLSTGSIGSVKAIDNEMFSSFTGEQQLQLMKTADINQMFNDAKRDLEAATGSSLDKILDTANFEGVYKNKSINGKNAMKDYMVRRYIEYKKKNDIPGVDTIQRWAFEAVSSSVTPEESALLKAQDSMSIRHDLSVAMSEAELDNRKTYAKEKSRTEKSERKNAEKILNDMASNKLLTETQRIRIRANKEYLIDLYLGKAYDQILDFIEIAKRG